jgi:hypothetical protein
VDHFTCSVIEANLNRLSELSAVAADRVLVLRAQLLIARRVIDENYEISERLQIEQKPSVSGEFIQSVYARNCKAVLRALCEALKVAKNSTPALDPSGEFERDRRSYFSNSEWEVMSKASAALEAKMNLYG